MEGAALFLFGGGWVGGEIVPIFQTRRSEMFSLQFLATFSQNVSWVLIWEGKMVFFGK